MKATNLNYLFIDQIANFSHLVTTETQTKQQFAANIKATYCTSNPKTELFYQSVLRSEFETIRLDKNRTTILLNQ